MTPLSFSNSDPRKLLKKFNINVRSNISTAERIRKLDRILQLLKSSDRYDKIRIYDLDLRLKQLKERFKDL